MNKNIIIIIFLIIGMLVIFNFRGHNQNRVIDACVAGSQKLDQPMTIEEAKKFCEEQIKDKK
jgi:predicted negative regulator of RcsB-dependent stress response|tara:strand:+ start:366 stop:551 length:186 start_codon:yes stop_codon:yes gene_type:complete